MRKTLLALGLFSALSLSSAAANAKEWFVQAGASGTGEAGSPFGSIQQGIDAAQPGDIVTVAAGSYAESLVTKRDGSAQAPITLRASAGQSVVVSVNDTLLR